MSVATELPKKDLSRYWLQYFVANTTSRLEIPWKRGAEITAAGRAASSRQRTLPSNLRSRRCSIEDRLGRRVQGKILHLELRF